MYGPIRRAVKIYSDQSNMYELKDLLLHNTLFYLCPPLCAIPLQEMEELAVERLEMLRIFESSAAKYPDKRSDEYKQSVLREMNGKGLKSYVRLLQGNGNTPADLEARRRDYLSHFILRFAYCRTDDLKHWFISREMDVFWFKFKNLTTKDIFEFKKAYNFIDTEAVSDEEKREIQDQLLECTSERSTFKVEEMDFYKIKFTEVLGLVEQRKCFVKLGYAYVSASKFGHIVAPKFEKIIEKGLREHAELLPQLEDDERISGIIKDLHTSYSGKDFTLATHEVAIENLDQLSKKSYPLCMRLCHDTLRATHKLKHNGRLQYQLFLKGIGVSMEDSIQFFRKEFTRAMDADTFKKKNYEYNIRYNYGKEGARRNISPFSCMKIITENSISGDDVHGCPFRLYAPVDLKASLVRYGLSTLHAEEVTDYARNGHYQVACQRYFEVVHDTKLLEGISHPNRYFELSQEVMGKRQPKTNTINGKKGKGFSQDIILKRNKLQNLMNEDEEELIKITQTQEDVYMKSQSQAQEQSTKTNYQDPFSDDDDIDYSKLDDSIAMQQY